jgi:hypothetical protein
VTESSRLALQPTTILDPFYRSLLRVSYPPHPFEQHSIDQHIILQQTIGSPSGPEPFETFGTLPPLFPLRPSLAFPLGSSLDSIKPSAAVLFPILLHVFSFSIALSSRYSTLATTLETRRLSTRHDGSPSFRPFAFCCRDLPLPYYRPSNHSIPLLLDSILSFSLRPPSFPAILRSRIAFLPSILLPSFDRRVSPTTFPAPPSPHSSLLLIVKGKGASRARSEQPAVEASGRRSSRRALGGEQKSDGDGAR